ncbi:unnamed protein product [marine sediment metagenome]|uniref:Uncharacterized protein n=1 Tax=marine sediment metagenome TaxID=412755 RepID=X0YJC0_9ZZZZ
MNLMPIESFIKVTFGVVFQVTPIWILGGIALAVLLKILWHITKTKVR